MKYLIFDAGPIISLSMNGLLPIIEKLKETTDAEFILTPDVYREVVTNPLKIKKFKLEAIKVKSLIDKGVFKMSNEVVENSKLESEKNKILKATNGFLRYEKTNEKVTIIHDGEASCIAFSKLCNCENLIVVDERITRMLFESSENLKNLIEKKIHNVLSETPDLIKDLGEYKFIRSSELVYIAYKKDLIGYGKGKDIVDALLYSLKFNGTTISSREIEYIKNHL